MLIVDVTYAALLDEVSDAAWKIMGRAERLGQCALDRRETTTDTDG